MERKRFYIKNHTEPIIAYVNIKRNKVIYSLDNEKKHIKNVVLMNFSLH